MISRGAISALVRRRFPEICGAALGLGFGAISIFLMTPANFLSRLVIVSGPNCGKSEILVRSILADPALQEVFTPLTSTDDESDPTAAGVCEIAHRHLLARAPWFRLAGRDWVCRRLKETAMHYRDEAHGVLPVWVHNGTVVDVGERDKLLANAGYYLLPGGEGVVPSDEYPESVDRRPPATPSGAVTEWRGQNIGF